jgi:hypothetical protein
MRRGSGSSDDGSIDRSMTIALRQKKKKRETYFSVPRKGRTRREKRNGGERREDRDAKEGGRAPLQARVEPRAFEARDRKRGKRERRNRNASLRVVGTTIDCASSIIF